MLTNCHIIFPAALFGSVSLPLVASQIQRINVVQRRMLRAIVGWVAVDGNEWRNAGAQMGRCVARVFVNIIMDS